MKRNFVYLFVDEKMNVVRNFFYFWYVIFIKGWLLFLVWVLLIFMFYFEIIDILKLVKSYNDIFNIYKFFVNDLYIYWIGRCISNDV